MKAISVIIILYNMENYAEQCINSVLNQTFQDIEIILVNDGSDDATPQICELYAQKDSRVKVIHKKNGGLVSARKAGVEIAEGKLISFVDGDDWIDKEQYGYLYNIYSEYKPDIVCAGIIRDRQEKMTYDTSMFEEGYYDKTKLLQEVYPSMMYSPITKGHCLDPSLCTKLFSRKIISQVISNVDDDIFYYGEDAATTYPCILVANSLYITKKCMYHHRKVEGQKEGTYKREFAFERLISFYRNINHSVMELGYEEIMLPQITGYFYNMLKFLVKEATNLDLSLWIEGLLSGFQTDNIEKRKIKYKLPFKKEELGKEIVLYGAGNVGRDFYFQVKDMGCNVLAWIDKNPQYYHIYGLKIEDKLSVHKYKDKKIIIAVKNENVMNEIKSELVSMGAKDILWKMI